MPRMLRREQQQDCSAVTQQTALVLRQLPKNLHFQWHCGVGGHKQSSRGRMLSGIAAVLLEMFGTASNVFVTPAVVTFPISLGSHQVDLNENLMLDELSEKSPSVTVAGKGRCAFQVFPLPGWKVVGREVLPLLKLF